jgi:hypothetical protein
MMEKLSKNDFMEKKKILAYIGFRYSKILNVFRRFHVTPPSQETSRITSSLVSSGAGQSDTDE